MLFENQTCVLKLELSKYNNKFNKLIDLVFNANFSSIVLQLYRGVI